MNLPNLIGESENNPNIKVLLGISVKRIFNNRKPLTEILNILYNRKVVNDKE